MVRPLSISGPKETSEAVTWSPGAIRRTSNGRVSKRCNSNTVHPSRKCVLYSALPPLLCLPLFALLRNAAADSPSTSPIGNSTGPSFNSSSSSSSSFVQCAVTTGSCQPTVMTSTVTVTITVSALQPPATATVIPPTPTPVPVGSIPSTASIVVFLAGNGSCLVSAVDGTTGAVCAASCNATEVINAAVGRCLINDATGVGGVVQVRRGIYNLSGPINMSTSGVTLQGEGGGDLYFTADGTYHGVANKAATLLVADGPYDAIQVKESRSVALEHAASVTPHFSLSTDWYFKPHFRRHCAVARHYRHRPLSVACAGLFVQRWGRDTGCNGRYCHDRRGAGVCMCVP